MLKSWLFLAFNFILAQVKKILGMRKGEKSFIKNYAEDGIYPLSPEIQEVILSMEKCISCGYCEIKGKKGISLLPHIIRDIAQYETFPVDEFLSGEEVCPFGVNLSNAKVLTKFKETNS